MLKEFKEFAMKGSVLDMAIGIIIGGAFTPIVKGLVDHILMPPLGLLMGGVDFANKFVVLKPGADGASTFETLELAQEAGAVTVNYGLFLNSIVTFLIVAFAVFLLVKNINRMKQEEEAPPEEPTSKECTFCVTEIPIQATRCPNCTSELQAA
jgi:large conductance mechanosensitive channel